MENIYSHAFEIVHYWLDFGGFVVFSSIILLTAHFFSRRTFGHTIFSRPVGPFIILTFLIGAIAINIQTNLDLRKIPDASYGLNAEMHKYYINVLTDRFYFLIILGLFISLETIFGIFVSQTKHERDNIKKASQIFASVFENSMHPHIIYNAIGIIRCNNAALKSLNASTHLQIINHSPIEFASFHQTNRKSAKQIYTEQEEVVLKENFSRFEMNLKKINGAEFPASVTLSNLQLDEQPYFLMVWEDLTEKIKTQELLELEKAKTLQASKLATLGEVSANISHEIGNPLMMFISYASTLRRMVEGNQMNFNTILDISERIEKTVVRITKIVKGLKNFARDGAKDEYEPTILNQLINDSLEFIQNKINLNLIQLSVNLPNTPVEADCRSVQISQVLLNLINNAIDAIQNNPEKWIKIELTENAIFAMITVTDSGHGIPDAIADQIMHPFFTTKDKSTGTGLGLSLSLEIMKDHKGQLFLDRRNANTRFVMKWPKHLIETDDIKKAV